MTRGRHSIKIKQSFNQNESKRKGVIKVTKDVIKVINEVIKVINEVIKVIKDVIKVIKMKGGDKDNKGDKDERR